MDLSDEGLYRALAESSHDIIFVIDKHGRVRYVNSFAAAFFGAPSEQIQGKHLGELFPPEAYEFQSRALQSVFETGEPFFTEENSSFANRKIWLETRLIPIRGRNNSVDLVMGVTRDITERKLAEQERDRLIADLQEALAEIKTLRGVLPVCASCKKIRDENGSWKQMEAYISEHSAAQFSHSYCPECAARALKQSDTYRNNARRDGA